MPAGYDSAALSRDINSYSDMLNYLARRQPKYVKEGIFKSPLGTNFIFMTNSMNNVKVTPRRPEKNITNYAKRMEIEGDVDVWSHEKVFGAEIVFGASLLPNELPPRSKEGYPHYGDRVREKASYNYNISYAAARLALYARA